MERIAEWFRRLWYLANRSRVEAELRAELAQHRAELGDDTRFGSDLRIREDVRAVWGWRWLDSMLDDLRLAVRALRRDAVYACTAMASIAIGLGLVASTMTVTEAYGERALPYREPSRLYHVRYAPPGPWEPANVRHLEWSRVRDVVSHAITSRGAGLYPVQEGSVPLRVLRVDTGFIAGLGVSAVIGRTLTVADFQIDAEPLAMISHALWRSQLAGDSAISGKFFRTRDENGVAMQAFRIIGVLPPEFYFGRDSREPTDLLTQRLTPAQTYMVRLREGATVAIAEQRLAQALRAVSNDIPPDWTGVQLQSVHERYVQDVRPVLRTVSGASVIVLLVVCLNVGVLVLLRSIKLQREVAIRAALGASRLRLARAPAVETLLVCAVGLLMALLLAAWVSKEFGPAIADYLGRPAPRGAAGIALTARTTAMMTLVAASLAFVLTLVRVLSNSPDRLVETLRSVERAGSMGPVMRRARSALMVFEIGASVSLLIWCGLMLRSSFNLVNADRGFDPTGIVRARIEFPSSDFPDFDRRKDFFDRYRALILAATRDTLVFSSWPPYSETAKQTVEASAGGQASAGYIAVSDGYFSAMRVPILQGRDFALTDRPGGTAVTIISQTLARQLWGDSSAIGRTLRLINHARRDSVPSPPLTVIGVVGDVRQSFADTDLADLYTAYLQAPPNTFASAYVRSDRGPDPWSATLRTQVTLLAPRATVTMPTRLNEEDREGAEAIFLASLLSALAFFTMVLATVGIVGVTAYTVRQRRHEMAIRMALGATGHAISAVFLKAGVQSIATGVGAGLVLAVGGARLLANRVYGVQVVDVPTYLTASLLLAWVMLGAVWWIARGASAEDNLKLLRDGEQ